MDRAIVLKTAYFLLMMTLITATVGLSGCALGGGPAVQEGPPPIKMTVAKIEQYKKFHDKTADGQYVVVLLKIQNQTNESIELFPHNFLLQNITNKPEEQYSQGTEKSMRGAFMNVYGFNNRDKIMETVAVMAHPRIELKRYLVYMLPPDVDLQDYQLNYKPYNYSEPLVAPYTEVVDHREGFYDEDY